MLLGSKGWIVEVVDLRESDSTREGQQGLRANEDEISGVSGTPLLRVLIDVKQNGSDICPAMECGCRGEGYWIRGA